jgi:hypothetical protein
MSRAVGLTEALQEFNSLRQMAIAKAAYQRILVPFYSDPGLRAVGYLYAAATNGRHPTGA